MKESSVNKKPRIIATCGRKYEPDFLIEDWKQNLNWVDGFAIVDCRDRTDELWIDETELYTMERELAGSLDADWILVVSPDERLDINAERIIRRAVQGPQNVCYTFRIRELFTPDHYRVDGWWDTGIQKRLYHYNPDHEIKKKKLHTSPVPPEAYKRTCLLGCDLYHLKHIEPENRIARSKVFSKLDPLMNDTILNNYTEIADEEGMRLKKISSNKPYFPAYDQPYYYRPPKELYDS